MDAIMRKYGFRDWDAALAAVGHGGLKEGQVVNKLQELYEKQHKKEITDEKIIEAAESNDKVRISKSKGGIVVKGIDDVAVRFSKCCSPVPGDEIVGYVTRGRGVSIHRTDCVNIINLSSEERVRLIDAEWQQPEVPSVWEISGVSRIYVRKTEADCSCWCIWCWWRHLDLYF